MSETDLRPARPVQGAARRTYAWLAATVAVWVAAVLVLLLLDRADPFAAPLAGPQSLLGRLLTTHAELAEQLLLIGVIVLLTRRRRLPDIAGRAPATATSRREVAALVGYAVGVQVLGYLVGVPLLGSALSLHLPEPLYGNGTSLTAPFVAVWAAWNFVAYAVLPYLYFRRRRGYTHEQLQLKSSDLRSDVRLVAVVLTLESLAQLTFNHSIFALSGRQLLIGIPLTFAVYLVGTGLPVMVFIYSVLVPRYLRLTGSRVATVILGGLTYAAVHFFDAQGSFDTPAHWLRSGIFVLFTYFGPGMVKTALTLRTGNAWVHLWAYHAVAPHVWFDTPVIVDALHIG